jgi:hypothetical protein
LNISQYGLLGARRQAICSYFGIFLQDIDLFRVLGDKLP